MAVNDLTFTQVSTLLNSVVSQATGKAQMTPTNTSEFVALGQLALKTGYDPILNAVSQVLSRTIFSMRPYYAKFPSIRKTEQRFGNHVRKLQISDSDWENDTRYSLTDATSVDMFKVKKANVLQTNFYGSVVYEYQHPTIYRDQLDCAFTSPDELSRFWSMLMENTTNKIEQGHENLIRSAVTNFIGGTIAAGTGNVVHLLTDYNAALGLTGNAALTYTTVMAPENYAPFMRWVFARIATLQELMTERSQKFHQNITGKPVNRHTPLSMQNVYIAAEYVNQMEANSLSVTYHDNLVHRPRFEKVGYWQAIDTPLGINVTPSYLKADGTIATPEAAVSKDHVFGLIVDDETIGMTTVNAWSAPTPFNAKGGYTNIFFHYTDRYYNDFTENGIVLLMD